MPNSKKTKRGSAQDVQEKNKKLQYNLELPYHHKFNRPFVKRARNLFIRDYDPDLIVPLAGVPPEVVRKLAPKWQKIKDKVDEKLIVDVRGKIVAEEASDIMKKGMHVINLFLTRVIKRGTEQDAKDVKLTSDIMANLHRIKQLEEGKPTDISMYEKMTPQQIAEAVVSMQKELSAKHDMSMFAIADETEEELLAECKRDSGIH